MGIARSLSQRPLREHGPRGLLASAGLCALLLSAPALRSAELTTVEPEPAARAPGEATALPTQSAAERFPQNGCIGCHADAPGELSQAVEDWSRSIHSENSVTCDSCHGGDPAVRGTPTDRQAVDAAHFSALGFIQRPHPAKVSYFCGQCHVAIKEKHLGSPHGENVHPTCVFCHGHHRVQSSTTEIIRPERCTTCHDFRNAGEIRKTLEKTEQSIRELEDDTRYLEDRHYKNLALEEMHHHTTSTLTQLRVSFHSFNLGDVTNFASQIEAVLEQTRRAVEIVGAKESAKQDQTYIGVGIAVFLFLFSVLLMRYKKVFLDH